ncbi:MAG: hypothetical protein JRH16_14935 [Deltaproteobacteria bacterium]|nr:hypothetical protein [Deltaproteobacteria bacterium]MBW2361275.1 hypothetical protein [Deltaproteobacteria bacterium]
MSSQSGVGLPEALERAASALPSEADAIRPANGDPAQLIELLDPSAASRVLRWLLVEEPQDGAELLGAWLDVPERGAAAVLGVDADGMPKPARKALRRAHHQLRSRGVEVPDSKPAPTVAKLPNVEEAFEEAMLSPLDPRGGRAAYLVTPNPQGGVRMFEVLFDDTRGILECRVYNTGRSKVRNFLKELERKGALAVIATPPDAVRALVERAAEAHPADRPLPRAFHESRSQVGRAPQGSSTPGDLVRETLGVPEGPSGGRRAAELVKRGEIGPWPPAQEALTAVAEKLDSIATSTLIVSAEQRREQMHAAIDDALPEVYAAPFATQTATRLEETAYVLWKREKDDDARACLAAAAAFRAGDSGENETARAMLEKALAPIFRKAEENVEGGADEPAAALGPEAPR